MFAVFLSHVCVLEGDLLIAVEQPKILEPEFFLIFVYDSV